MSAGSSAVEARDPKKHAIMMLRGKCISVLKATKDKVLANKEYNDIITAIGAGFDETFDLKKMNYSKIVITSDFDSDGQNIELLLITFFFRYMRPLVEAGKLYRAVTPLYVATYKGKDYYLYSEEELEEFRKGKGAFDLSHNKGLGELNPEDLKKLSDEMFAIINKCQKMQYKQLEKRLMQKLPIEIEDFNKLCYAVGDSLYFDKFLRPIANEFSFWAITTWLWSESEYRKDFMSQIEEHIRSFL